ncbi:MAG: DNA (cytosine-5-)-methyltransferase [Clostridia bacterium]|nr:DNA (cytosine-5-)-methyltransferase [Clostridia bacterium]
MKINTFFDFCSGIGGGRLGLEQAGLKCVGRSETSRLADTTYRLMHNEKNEYNYGNLKKICGDILPAFDLLIAGFPCQTFSVIGQQEGFSDDRGQIIFHPARISKETKPTCFILENVKGLVTHGNGKTIKVILNELTNSGYTVSYRVLTSLEHGVPQMRQRVYFLGFKTSLVLDHSKFEWPEPVLAPSLSDYLIDNNLATEERLDVLKYYLNTPTNTGKYTINDICAMEGKIIDTRMSDLRIYTGKCPTLRAQRDGIFYVRTGKTYQLTGFEALLLQGFPKEYADKVKNKVTDRHLLMQAGNAMTVNVIAKLGKCIIKFLENEVD